MIFLKLIWSYIKIGMFGFGGGYAMLALIQNEIVLPGWVTDKMFTDIVAISQMTPGPIGINSATYIGYVAPLSNGFDFWLWGILGSLVCTLVVIIPSFLLVTYASHYISRNRDSVLIKGIFSGLRPVVVGLIASAALLLMNSDNFGETNYDVTWSIAICVASLLTARYTKIHPIFIIILAAIIGLFIF